MDLIDTKEVMISRVSFCMAGLSAEFHKNC